jgi:hypothetical protein
MRAILAMVLVLAVAACGPRQVDLDPGAATGPDATLRVTNNHTQAVNVYVVQGGSEMLVGQVAANTTQQLPVSGISRTQAVTLRARSTDGTRNWERSGVTLTDMYDWRVP